MNPMIRTLSPLRLPGLALGAALALSPAPARAEEAGVSVGDATHGGKLFARECASCHGDDGRGGKSGVTLVDSGRMNLLRDEEVLAMLKTGAGLAAGKDHALGDRLAFLELWDVVAHLRSQHLTVADFFPKASRFLVKVYEIDASGLGRIEKAAGSAPKETRAAVFTLFTFPGEEGALAHVPQDPIQIDQLTKDRKSGYLVFLPFSHAGFEGELGIAMEADGKIARLLVHPSAKQAATLNRSLASFVGLGKKGQKEPFKLGGGKPVADLAAALFPVYLRAMETVTMYDREERERTWADDR